MAGKCWENHANADLSDLIRLIFMPCLITGGYSTTNQWSVWPLGNGINGY